MDWKVRTMDIKLETNNLELLSAVAVFLASKREEFDGRMGMVFRATYSGEWVQAIADDIGRQEREDVVRKLGE